MKKLSPAKYFAPTYILLSILTATLFIINACRKSDRVSNDFDVAAAKEWWYGTYKKSVEYKQWEASYRLAYGRKGPDWNKGVYLKRDGVEIVELPLVYEKKQILSPKDNTLSPQDKQRVVNSIVDRLLIIKTPRGTIETRVVRYIPSMNYLREKGFDISSNKAGSLDPTYSGNIYIKRWNEQLIHGYVMEKGKAIKIMQKKSTNAGRTACWECEEVIYDIWEVTCEWVQVGDSPAVEECETVWVGEEYTEECTYNPICSEDPEDPDPCFELSSYECMCTLFGLYCDGPPGGGGGGGGSVLPVLTGVDQTNVNDPCLKAIISQISSGAYMSLILRKYYPATPPTTPPQFSVEYDEDSSQPTAGHMDLFPDGNGNFKVKITLNPATFFQNSTKEYVTAVILHELLHGLLQASQPALNTNALQHQNMWDHGGPTAIFLSLKELFTTIPDASAMSLGMDGLSDITGAGPTYTQAIDDFATANYGISMTTASPIMSAYRVHTTNGPGSPYC